MHTTAAFRIATRPTGRGSCLHGQPGHGVALLQRMIYVAAAGRTEHCTQRATERCALTRRMPVAARASLHDALYHCCGRPSDDSRHEAAGSCAYAKYPCVRRRAPRLSSTLGCSMVQADPCTVRAIQRGGCACTVCDLGLVELGGGLTCDANEAHSCWAWSAPLCSSPRGSRCRPAPS